MGPSKKKILMVDDDEEICQEMSQILADEGYKIETAFDGISARDLIASNSYDLILLDLKIPRLSGFELLKLIKKNDGPKVIVVSARPMKKLSREKSFIGESGTSDEEEEKILQLADEFINKPFDVDNVLKKIEEV